MKLPAGLRQEALVQGNTKQRGVTVQKRGTSSYRIWVKEEAKKGF